ncbi:hypothetical protein, partial [Klebsiella pneumoniae]
YAGYRKNNKVLGRDYDYSSCSLSAPTASTPPGEFNCGGSGTSFPGQFTDFGGNEFLIDTDNDPTTDDIDVNPMPSFAYTV